MTKQYQLESTSLRSGKIVIVSEFNTFEAAKALFDFAERNQARKSRRQFMYCIRDTTRDNLIIWL